MTGFWRIIVTQLNPGRRGRTGILAALLLAAVTAHAATLAEAQRDYLEGDYGDAVKAAQAALKESAPQAPTTIDWTLVLVQSLLATGRNAEADAAMKEALERDSQSVRLRWQARDVAFANGRPEEAQTQGDEIIKLVQFRQYMYRTPTDLVVFGRAALLRGADPKDVLDKLFATAQQTDPKLRDVYLARGELALEKHDFALAARAFEDGIKQLPEDPDLHAGRARAYADGDREVAHEAIKAALDINPRHVPSLLMRVDHQIDAEAYAEAEKLLAEIVAINPVQPDAWAYRAVLAHLRNDLPAEATARSKALASWTKNPRVDYLIGKKLAQKYRFAEAAAYQRRARSFDPTFLPAAAALAQDLLRLGEEAEGWALAQEVYDRDEYDVEAYNLVTLRDTMKKYATLSSDDFIVRMASPEVAVYGPRVLALLRRAKKMLTEKYGAELQSPTYVEIFAEQKDFAVRTFGLPDVAGFLGVCFGRVVTANSPAQSTTTNWEAVLWHEFCHVVTLQLTKNKMPRWLSEGISVYEERQVDPAWGMRLNPRYRDMIMQDELVPVGQLSAAFLSPKTPQHLQFAYLQSSMVVEYIIDRFGIGAIRGILMDLREGVEINVALAKHTVPLADLETDFEKHARGLAEKLAPGLNWERPEPALFTAAGAEDLAKFAEKNPDNYWVLRFRAARSAEEQKWPEARKSLERLVELYPEQKGPESPYRQLVAALRALGDTAAERKVLQKWAAIDDEATDAYGRLLELAAADKDWEIVARMVERYLAVNPLVAPPYRYLAQAAAELKNDSAAVVAWRTLIQLDTADPATAHYELAQLLHRRGEADDARRHVLMALEETPRYRAALRLLAAIPPRTATTPATAESGQPAPAPVAPELPLVPVPVPAINLPAPTPALPRR